jgi:lipoprotein
MTKLFKYTWLVGLMALCSCADDKLGEVPVHDLNRFEFPQGNNPWDKEIEQIANDWGMYIIYKNVDSTNLNQVWTMPDFRNPIYVCDEPSDEQIQEYLRIIEEGLLTTLDKAKENDRKQLPVYLYLVNNFRDNNQKSETYGKTVQIKLDGFDYWSLSFTDQEWEEGISAQTTHKITCAFGYPKIEAALLSGEISIPSEFSRISDYTTRIGTTYISFEQFLKDNMYLLGMPEAMQKMIYENTVRDYERDNANVYTHRGFVPDLSKDFVVVTRHHGCPDWMPWIKFQGIMDENRNYLETEEERLAADFLGYVRYAMTYTEEYIRTNYPMEGVKDEYALEGNKMINQKYDIVVEYIKSSLGIDLPKYAAILENVD